MKVEVSMIPDFSQIEKSVELSKKYGVYFEYDDFFAPAVYNDDEEVNRRIEKYMSFDRDRSKDTLHGVFLDIVPHSNDTYIAEYSKKCMKKSMEIAKRLQVKGVVFHTGLLAGFKDYKYVTNWLNTCIEFFTDLCQEYSDMYVYVENMFDLDYELIWLLCNRMQEVPNFGLCLDYAHASISNIPADEWLRNCGQFIKHMHINDNDLSNDLHMPLGKGEINWQEFKTEFEILVENGVIKESPNILLEVSSLESFEESIEYFNKLFV